MQYSQSKTLIFGFISYLCTKTTDMIAEIKFKNMYSFRDETVLSFEADKSEDMASYHVV